jgi:hypothetical protein
VFYLCPNAWNRVSSDEGLEDSVETDELEGATGLGSGAIGGIAGDSEACNLGDAMRISWRHEGQNTLLVNHWSIHTLW